jgi:hypothetical protein
MKTEIHDNVMDHTIEVILTARKPEIFRYLKPEQILDEVQVRLAMAITDMIMEKIRPAILEQFKKESTD